MTSADIIIINARVLTMNKAQPRAEALAIAGNRIAAVGHKADILALRAKHTRLIDAGMKTVMPGIVEGHVHLFGGSVELDSLMLNGINGFDRIAESVSQYRKSRPGPGIVVATGIAHESFGRDTPITRQLLDRIVADVPFIAVCFDHHTVWANTRAIEAAGVMRGRQLPTGNEIVLDAGGLATGELREPAAYMFALALTPTGGREWLGMTTGENPVPPATTAERAIDEAYFRKGIAHAASLGITSMHNMDGNLYQLERLQALLDRGELDARVEVPFHQKSFFGIARLDEAVEWRAKYKGDMLHCGRVKVFIDGVLETLTALMLDDYPGYPGNKGAPLFTAEEFNEIVTHADRHGLQVSTHAIGDGGVRRTLDGYEAARRANGSRDSRHRIEHIELIDPADIPRLKQLGVVASLQPIAGVGVPGNPHEPILSRVGEKLPYAYAWQTLRDTGAMVAFSSDWPVAPLDPWRTVYAAVTRIVPEVHPEGWIPEESITVEEALAAYTTGSAHAEFTEREKGRLAQGYLADLVVLDRDPFAIPATELEGVHAVMTIVGGRIVWSSGEIAGAETR